MINMHNYMQMMFYALRKTKYNAIEGTIVLNELKKKDNQNSSFFKMLTYKQFPRFQFNAWGV